MFQERPFRQQRQSAWSIWWFVGFMAIGLTLWHLEMIPFSQPSRAELGLKEDPVDLEAFSGLETSFLETHVNEPAPFPNEIAFDSSSPVSMSPVPSTAATSLPREPEVPASQTSQNSIIQQTSYEQPAAPVIHSGGEVPVQTLTYRPAEKPVTIQPIPLASGLPPVQTADYQQSHPETTFQPEVVTAQAPAQLSEEMRTSTPLKSSESEPVSTPEDSSSQPAHQPVLSPEIERDIVRLRELSSRYWKQEELRLNVDQEMADLAEKIYFSPEVHYLPAYRVQPGDQLRLIAKNHQVSWQYLARLNHVDPEKIRPGQELKMMKGPFHAVVDLSDRTLTVHAHGYYMASFPVSIGKDNATPVGEFPVINKVENPTYYGPEGIIGSDDPRNPLGEHWIDLGNSYGIHGTINPNSVGEAVSKGCLRMHAEDVAIVYDLLTLDSIVIIRP